MSYKRISIRFNLDIEDERNAWELLHSSNCGPINKEVIDSINTAHKLSTLEALLRKVISEELRNISLHIPFEPDTDSASDENESSIMDSPPEKVMPPPVALNKSAYRSIFLTMAS